MSRIPRAGGLRLFRPSRRSDRAHPDCVRRVVAGAVSGQMHGAVFLDRSGRALRPAILWNDGRSEPQCDEITRTIGLRNLVSAVGNCALAGFTAPKVLWVREHEPDVYKETSTILLPKDYINFRLTGVIATEPSDASGTLLFDVVNRRWSEAVLRQLDIPESLMPEVRPSASVVGLVSREAAWETGLSEGLPIAAGGADNACAAIGSGIVEEGSELVSIGTSGTVLAPSSQPRFDPEGRLHSFCHAIPDRWYMMGVVLSAGASLRWYRDTLCPLQTERAALEQRDAYDLIAEEAETVPIGSEGLIFLPYLSGERTPHADAWARGVFVGLSLRHTHAHISRSVFEGITFALKDSATLIDGLGISPQSRRMTGGGARSMFWRRLLADILGATIEPALSDLGPALGAALLAGSGVGMVDSISDAAARFSVAAAAVEPDSSAVGEYEAIYRRFRDLYPALRQSFHSMAEV